MDSAKETDRKQQLVLREMDPRQGRLEGAIRKRDGEGSQRKEMQDAQWMDTVPGRTDERDFGCMHKEHNETGAKVNEESTRLEESMVGQHVEHDEHSQEVANSGHEQG